MRSPTLRYANIIFKASRRPSELPTCLHRPVDPPQLQRKHLSRSRRFHASTRRDIVRPYLLADIGEGITECQIIQWFVQPGARVEQFDKICEVQSDKASVEITSRYDGVIKKLYYEADDMAKVGKPLIDIDVQGVSPEDESLLQDPGAKSDKSAKGEDKTTEDLKSESIPQSLPSQSVPTAQNEVVPSRPAGKHASLATPAVRHLTKELKVSIEDIPGSGKDGRVLKEDVHKYAASRSQTQNTPPANVPPATPAPQGEDKLITLTPVQKGMFKTMTRSLTVPHFLYSDIIDFTSLTATRRRLNASHSSSEYPHPKLSSLPFIVKAVSLALQQYPTLNAQLETSDKDRPQMILKADHNIGIAVDSPSGLLVPVVRRVQDHSIASLALEVARLGALAREGKLTSSDLSGATFTVSNVGSIGGTVVAPVIVPPQIGILGIGKSRVVPAFDEEGMVVRKEECVFSWSADHRVVDGATAARCAEVVRGYLENVETMLVRLR